jgi:hypothetical protein
MIAEEKYLKMIKRLLMIKININIIAADHDDQTTLQMIVDEKHLEMMKRLLMTDVNINIVAVDNDD